VDWTSQEVYKLRAELEQRTAERDALAAEVAALKAQADPLAEMWRELSEYQPFANRDNHGVSWNAMCKARTVEAAFTASAAAGAGWEAAAAAGCAIRSAERAIAAIRRAKEARP